MDIDATAHFEIRVVLPKRVYVIHKRTNCNAVPQGKCFTSQRRARKYLERVAPLLVRGNLLRISPETQAQCAAVASELDAR